MGIFLGNWDHNICTIFHLSFPPDIRTHAFSLCTVFGYTRAAWPKAGTGELPKRVSTGWLLSWASERTTDRQYLSSCVPEALNPPTCPSQNTWELSLAPPSFHPHPRVSRVQNSSSVIALDSVFSQPPKRDPVTLWYNTEPAFHAALPSSVCFPQAAKSSFLKYKPEEYPSKASEGLHGKAQVLNRPFDLFLLYSYLLCLFPALLHTSSP